MASTSTISEKGQVTIPKALPQALGIRAGDRLTFELRADTIRIRKDPDLDRLASVYGSLKFPVRSTSSSTRCEAGRLARDHRGRYEPSSMSSARTRS